MSRTIWFETHATSLDNEAGLASGHFDVDLSPAGVAQAEALGRRYVATTLERVLTSDLRRASRTAALAFGTRVHVRIDPRLREVDYGRLTRAPAGTIEAARHAAVRQPFPGGESYEGAIDRVRRCIAGELASSRGDLLVIGHRATYYALEHLFKSVSLEAIVGASWQWQPGWRYEVTPDRIRRLRRRI